MFHDGLPVLRSFYTSSMFWMPVLLRASGSFAPSIQWSSSHVPESLAPRSCDRILALLETIIRFSQEACFLFDQCLTMGLASMMFFV
jgi:hypothetical protein